MLRIIIKIIIENIRLLMLNTLLFKIEYSSLLIDLCIILSNIEFREGIIQNRMGCIIIGNSNINQFCARNLDVDGSKDEKRLVIIFRMIWGF